MKKKIFDLFMNGGIMLMLLFVLPACNNEDEPEKTNGVIGKWQKYQVMNDDGSFSEGDLDEFWIFNADGSFENEDSGNMTTIGNYSVEGNLLTIYSHSVDDQDEEENFSGTFVIENNFMTYSFTDLRDGEKSTIRFKKM